MRALLVFIAACSSQNPWPTTGGDPALGKVAIENHGCAACHHIPEIEGPIGHVGPDLEGFSHRSFIAGEVPNTPANLVRWIRDPHELRPKTAMPNLNLTMEEARDVAAYLYSVD